MEDLFSTFYDRRVDGSRKWESVPVNQECEKNKIIPMTVADLDIPTSPKIVKGLNEYISNKVLGYSNSTSRYLKSVANHMEEKYNYIVESEWIVTTTGIVPALATSVRAFTEEGDGVIMFQSVYYPFYDVVEKQKIEIIGCPLILEDERYVINFDLFEKVAAAEKNKLVILCSP